MCVCRHNTGLFIDPFFVKVSPGLLAERAGFEPAIRGYRIHTFQACSFSHSDTSPEGAIVH